MPQWPLNDWDSVKSHAVGESSALDDIIIFSETIKEHMQEGGNTDVWTK